MFLAIALSAEISYLLPARDLPAARLLLDEAGTFTRTSDLMTSNLRLYEARYALLSGDIQTAETILNEVWPRLEKWRDAQFMAGYQSALASWWRVRALCAKERGLTNEEIKALRQVVHFNRVIAQAPQLEGPYQWNAVARALHQLGIALRDNNDPLSNHAFSESHSLRQQIGLPPID